MSTATAAKVDKLNPLSDQECFDCAALARSMHVFVTQHANRKSSQRHMPSDTTLEAFFHLLYAGDKEQTKVSVTAFVGAIRSNCHDFMKDIYGEYISSELPHGEDTEETSAFFKAAKLQKVICNIANHHAALARFMFPAQHIPHRDRDGRGRTDLVTLDATAPKVISIVNPVLRRYEEAYGIPSRHHNGQFLVCDLTFAVLLAIASPQSIDETPLEYLL
jgi:hypothetical protein